MLNRCTHIVLASRDTRVRLGDPRVTADRAVGVGTGRASPITGGDAVDHHGRIGHYGTNNDQEKCDGSG